MKKFLLLLFLVIFIVTSSIFLHKNPIDLCMLYLLNHTQETGRFVFETNLNPNEKINEKKYNMLIHAGTLHSMYLCEKLYNKSLREKRLLASKYFIENYLNKYNDMYAVYNNKAKVKYATVGGAGLALTSLSNLYNENLIEREKLEGLGQFIVNMQKPDGSFCQTYDITNNRCEEEKQALFHPGEASLGLLYLNDVLPDKTWVGSSKKALLNLANKRKNLKTRVPFDYCAIKATKKLLETPDNGLTQREIKALKMHSDQIAKSVLSRQITDKSDPYYGGFKNNTRLSSVGSIIEGLAAAYSCTDNIELKKQINEATKIGVNFLSRYQVKEGLLKGGIPADAAWKTSSKSEFSVIRIDYVQHVMSAMIMQRAMKANIKY